jgi:hypothetical protein
MITEKFIERYVESSVMNTHYHSSTGVWLRDSNYFCSIDSYDKESKGKVTLKSVQQSTLAWRDSDLTVQAEYDAEVERMLKYYNQKLLMVDSVIDKDTGLYITYQLIPIEECSHIHKTRVKLWTDLLNGLAYLKKMLQSLG